MDLGSSRHLTPIELSVAHEFLTRLDETPPEGIDVALGAHEDNGTLIGVAVLAAAGRRGAGLVAVVPARRRLHIGRDLLYALLDLGSARGLGQVIGPRPHLSPTADGLLRSVGVRLADEASESGTTG